MEWRPGGGGASLGGLGWCGDVVEIFDYQTFFGMWTGGRGSGEVSGREASSILQKHLYHHIISTKKNVFPKNPFTLPKNVKDFDFNHSQTHQKFSRVQWTLRNHGSGRPPPERPTPPPRWFTSEYCKSLKKKTYVAH